MRIGKRIGKTQAILAPFPREHTPWKCPWCLLASLAAAPAPSGSPPHRRAARRCAARSGQAAQVKGGWSVRGCFASGPRNGPAGKAGGELLIEYVEPVGSVRVSCISLAGEADAVWSRERSHHSRDHPDPSRRPDVYVSPRYWRRRGGRATTIGPPGRMSLDVTPEA